MYFISATPREPLPVTLPTLCLKSTRGKKVPQETGEQEASEQLRKIRAVREERLRQVPDFSTCIPTSSTWHRGAPGAAVLFLVTTVATWMVVKSVADLHS